MALDLFEPPKPKVQPQKTTRGATFQFPLRTWGKLDRLASHYGKSKIKVLVAIIESVYSTLTEAEKKAVEE